MFSYVTMPENSLASPALPDAPQRPDSEPRPGPASRATASMLLGLVRAELAWVGCLDPRRDAGQTASNPWRRGLLA